MNLLTTANTFYHWLTTTNLLVGLTNLLTDGQGSTFYANTHLVVTGSNSSVNVTSSATVNDLILTRHLVDSNNSYGTDNQILAKKPGAANGVLWVTPDSFSGYSGYSGTSGYSGYSGTSGYSGYSGTSGYSGFSGYSGQNGTIGVNGTSGYSGFSGYSGAAGSVSTPVDDTTTDASYYPLFVTAVSGTTTETSSTKLYYNPLTGTLNATVFNSLSDVVQKKNIVEINNALEILNKIKGVEFDWCGNDKHSAGVIAQELEKILPFLVETNEQGIKSVNYGGLIAYLIQANKELATRIEVLENK